MKPKNLCFWSLKVIYYESGNSMWEFLLTHIMRRKNSKCKFVMHKNCLSSGHYLPKEEKDWSIDRSSACVPQQKDLAQSLPLELSCKRGMPLFPNKISKNFLLWIINPHGGRAPKTKMVNNCSQTKKSAMKHMKKHVIWNLANERFSYYWKFCWWELLNCPS